MKGVGQDYKSKKRRCWFDCIFALLVVFILVSTTLLLPFFEPRSVPFLPALLPAFIVFVAVLWYRRSRRISGYDVSDNAFRWLMSLMLVFSALGFLLLQSFYEQTYFSDALIIREQVENLAQGGSWLPESRHYFLMYPNNMGITSLFFLIRSLAGSWKAVEVTGSLLCLVGVWLSALTVRHLTRNNILSLLAFLVCLFLAGGSVNSINPYSHNYGFPFVALAFYIYTSRLSPRWKCLLLSAAAAMGCYIKVTVLIPYIAIALIELFRALRHRAFRKIAYGILCPAICLAAMYCVQQTVWKQMGYQRDSSVSTSLPYFLATGQNNETVGRFSFPLMWTSEYMEDMTARQRDEVFLRLAGRSVKERGIMGNLRFFSHKTATTFGDGTLDDFRLVYHHPLALRFAFPFMLARQTVLYTLLFLLLLVPFPAITRHQRALALAFIGVFFYQMLFETHPRYLFMFLPILVTLPLSFDSKERVCD